ncbi:MAG: hypothetical protein K2G68_01920, partial [Helicobacter sp.]|nr:hypothetical protein [Helicobacter sp.]
MRKIVLVFLSLWIFSQIASAEVRVGHLFVMISDAMEEVKNSNNDKSLPILDKFKTEFDAIP